MPEGFNYNVTSLLAQHRRFAATVEIGNVSKGYTDFTGSNGAHFTSGTMFYVSGNVPVLASTNLPASGSAPNPAYFNLPNHTNFFGGDGGKRSGVIRTGTGQIRFYFDGLLSQDSNKTGIGASGKMSSCGPDSGDVFADACIYIASGTASTSSSFGWVAQYVGTFVTSSNPFSPTQMSCSYAEVAIISQSFHPGGAFSTLADPTFNCYLQLELDWNLTNFRW